ncbi:KfrB domain-containing protein [Bradyrhizobium ivorense]|uniref:KfrB domain-containing protein n=1 Tax=Bradyrhizobium ivorense TaxID=2511166 RepID=UPI0027E2BE4E|nr:KfrB domain-containing protein [Bradyrhizobium ivorense]
MDTKKPPALLKPEGSFKVSVMNHSRQVDQMIRGEWMTLKVLPEAGLPKGIYQLSEAVKPDRTAKLREYDGPVVHADSRNVYQLEGKGIVQHDRAVFRGVEPTVGRRYVIAYALGVGEVKGQREAAPTKQHNAHKTRGTSLD